MFGSHLSIAGSMLNALAEAVAMSMDTVQVFTKNQQQWKAKPLDPGMVRDWSVEVRRLGWDLGCPDAQSGLTRGRVVSHASYLINLASVNPDLWAKSVDLMTDELERCEALGIPFLVHHPGSFVGGDLEGGLSNIARAYAEVFRRTRGFAVISCLEGTAGAGSHIGGALEHLGRLREMIGEATGSPGRVGFCLDTCHLHAAGYDLSTRGSAMRVLEKAEHVLGLAHVRVLHVNDSKGACGSHLDRHEHIGAGHVGAGREGELPAGVRIDPKQVDPAALADSGFAAFVTHPALANAPKILETPKGDCRKGLPWDTVNLNRLRVLAGLPEVSPPTPGTAPATQPSKGGRTRASRSAKSAPRAKPTRSRAPSRPGGGPSKRRQVRRPRSR